MTTKTENKIEYFPIIDFMVDEIGKRIEGVHPIIKLLESQCDDTPEYHLLNKIWTDWCDYLEN